MEKPVQKDKVSLDLMPELPPIKQSEQINISIILDTYDDIFSDFDPRPYHERVLSEDFLLEVRRRHMPHTKGGLEVRFIVPDKMREIRIEAMIKRRLKSYFREEEKEILKRLAEKRRTGYMYIGVGGILLLAICSIILSFENDVWARVVELLLAPAAWFGMWEGMNKVVERDERLESELELSKLLSESVFAFIPESEALKMPQPAEGEPLSKEVIREIAKEVAKDVAKVHSEPDSAAKKTMREAIKDGMK